jgi:hypothetical protein
MVAGSEWLRVVSHSRIRRPWRARGSGRGACGRAPVRRPAGLTGACQVLKLARPLTFLREVFGEYITGGVAEQFTIAARQGSCLRVSLGFFLDGLELRLIQARPDDSWRCAD